MVNVGDVLGIELEDLAIELIQKHQELGMKATGEWEQSLEVDRSAFGASISALSYTEQLVQGRKPGRFPNIEKLKEWGRIKLGLRGKELDNAVFAIGKKIAKEGTEYYKQGGTDLVDSVLTKKKEQDILEVLAVELRSFVSDLLIRKVKELAV